LRRGPHIFQYGKGYDIIQRAIGEPAADLMQDMARWEWQLSKIRLKREQVAREREAERKQKEAHNRAADRRKWADLIDDDTFVEVPALEIEQAAHSNVLCEEALPKEVAVSARGHEQIDVNTTIGAPRQQQESEAATGVPILLSPIDSKYISARSNPLKKKFKMGKGDTLEMSKGTSSLSTLESTSFLTTLDPDYEKHYETHGFKLHDPAMHPATAVQVCTRDPTTLQIIMLRVHYFLVQKFHKTDTFYGSED